MNSKNSLKKSWMTKTVSLLGMSTAAIVLGLPALAGPTGAGGGFNNYANPFSSERVNAVNTDSPSYEPRDINTRDMSSSTGRGVERPERRDISRDMQESGPSNAPGQAYPGPSESPSGSPSVPGTSTYDDPSVNDQETNQGTFDQSRDSRDMRPDTMRPGTNSNGMERMEESGPSNAPDQSVPGPSETPSGSPSVDGTSDQDNPNRTN